jgi:hypothetical protein
MLDRSPVPVVVIMVCMVLYSRNFYRIAEVCWAETFVMFWSGVVHILTSVPDVTSRHLTNPTNGLVPRFVLVIIRRILMIE